MEQAGYKYLMRVGKGFHADCDLASEGVDTYCQIAGRKTRIIKLRLPGKDDTETLVTNMMNANIRKKAFKWLFDARWPAKAKPGYDVARSNLDIRFSGRTPCTVLQDLFASMSLANLYATYATLWQPEHGALRSKCIELMHEIANSPEAISIRDRYVGLELFDDEQKRQEELNKIRDVIERDFIPEVHKRQAPRKGPKPRG
jgi:hypothetical protein